MSTQALKPLSKEWFDDDREQYNIAVKSLPTLTTSNCSPEVIRHIAFLGEEVVRLRSALRESELHENVQQ